MEKKKTLHVVADLNGGWAVVRGGASRASKTFKSQQEAISWGREASEKQKTEFFIHRRDGTVEREMSRGSNPDPQDRKLPKGRNARSGSGGL